MTAINDPFIDLDYMVSIVMVKVIKLELVIFELVIFEKVCKNF